MIVPHVSGTRYSIFHFKCGYESPGTRKERRRVSSRSIEFGLTQRPFQRLGGGQEPIPGRHGVGEGGHSALDFIIPPPGPDINLEIDPEQSGLQGTNRFPFLPNPNHPRDRGISIDMGRGLSERLPGQASPRQTPGGTSTIRYPWRRPVSPASAMAEREVLECVCS